MELDDGDPEGQRGTIFYLLLTSLPIRQGLGSDGFCDCSSPTPHPALSSPFYFWNQQSYSFRAFSKVIHMHYLL